jgi:hypothetical protein
MQHKIREQVMDLTISDRLDAFRVQHLAGPFYYRHLLPALEKIFDELSNENEITSIDTLEIDLGFIPMKSLEATIPDSEWENRIREQLKTALQEQRKDAGIKRSGISANNCRHWLFYMEHGYLDWNVNALDEKALIDVLEMLATDFTLVLQLRRLVQKSAAARLRIVREHDEKFLVSLIEILTAVTQRDLAEAVKEAGTLLQLLRNNSAAAAPLSKQIEQEIWLSIIVMAAERIIGIETISFIETILLEEEYPTPVVGELQKVVENFKIIPPVWKKVQEKKSKSSEKPIAGKQEIKEQYPITLPNEIDEEGIFVSFAGLALLHPFISTFFKRLDLVAGSNFRDAVCTEKAVHLLYYLATGKTNPPEHELVIPKLFCALPIQQALKETIELTDKEKQEADDMIQAAIDKWEKLKNVSVDTLRQNFLIRPGKLYTKNDLLYLQVEGNSLDVLLDYLPWTLSIIKLLWMKELLRIEWR